MKQYKEITFDQFTEQYKPIPSENNIYFCTSGDRERVERENVKNVWTLVDGINGMYIYPGFRLVDRMEYIITEKQWEQEEIEVKH